MFDIDQNNNIIIQDPAILLIKEFKKLWDKDKSKDKGEALKVFAYIYLKNDFKSDYRKGHTQEELPMVLRDALGFDKKWKADADIIAAETAYSESKVTKSLKMLLAAESALEQITKYFLEFKIDSIEEDRKADAINKLKNNLKDIDEVVSRIEAAKDRIAKEEESKKLSGVKVLSSRELPKSKRK